MSYDGNSQRTGFSPESSSGGAKYRKFRIRGINQNLRQMQTIREEIGRNNLKTLDAQKEFKASGRYSCSHKKRSPEEMRRYPKR